MQLPFTHIITFLKRHTVGRCHELIKNRLVEIGFPKTPDKLQTI